MDPRHCELAEIALRAAGGGYGLALAGGYAVREHGMGTRPSGDVDLFTDWQRRADFPAAADLVIEALTDNGFAPSLDVAWRSSRISKRSTPSRRRTRTSPASARAATLLGSR